MISENKYWVTTIYKLYYINNYSYKDAIYKDQNLWKWNLSIIEKNFMVPMKKYYSILSAKIEKLLKQNFLLSPVILPQQGLVYVCLNIKHHYIIKRSKKISVHGQKLCGCIPIYSFCKALKVKVFFPFMGLVSNYNLTNSLIKKLNQ